MPRAMSTRRRRQTSPEKSGRIIDVVSHLTLRNWNAVITKEDTNLLSSVTSSFLHVSCQKVYASDVQFSEVIEKEE